MPNFSGKKCSKLYSLLNGTTPSVSTSDGVFGSGTHIDIISALFAACIPASESSNTRILFRLSTGGLSNFDAQNKKGSGYGLPCCIADSSGIVIICWNRLKSSLYGSLFHVKLSLVLPVTIAIGILW